MVLTSERRDVVSGVDDGVATIELNRARSLNAITPRLLEQLVEALSAVSTDPSVKVAVIQGAGTSFCAGFDLVAEQTTDGPGELRAKVEMLHDITRAIRRAPFPVIASVHGYALGAGCELALCSDLVIAARDAEFGFPEVDVALSVTGGISHLLPLTVGPTKAKELILLGRRFSAVEALRLNLINSLVEPGDLQSATRELAGELLAKPQLALAAAKATLDAAAPGSIDRAFEIETGYAMLTQSSTAATEAQRAFDTRRG
jgi:2-(1,2-epoxy-1,2-dihydrophenyl)acetyl-CoA isomerase